MQSFRVSINNLFLDPNNFRLRSHPQFVELIDPTSPKIMNAAVQERTRRLVAGKDGIEIKDLVDSLKTNGFLKVDNILVRKLEGTADKYLVIEGNRRVAALKQLQSSLRAGYDIGNLDPGIFDDPNTSPNVGVDVVGYSYNKEEDYLILMALRHVSGNKRWDRYNQAKLISELHEKGFRIEDIANRIGIPSKQAVQQQLDAYYAISDYLKRKDLYEDDSTFNPHEKFMIFIEALLKRNVREFLGWNNQEKIFTKENNVLRFYSWISPAIIPDYDDEDGDGEEYERKPPIIVNHKQVRQLDEIINDEESLSILEEKRDIDEALEQNSGYTQKKFTAELRKAEKILKNIKFGSTLKINDDEKEVLESIITLANKISG